MIKRLKYAGRVALGASRHTLLVLPLANRAYYELIARRGADVCIDGFQRCANTYAVALFSRRNPRLTVAHHTHVPGNVLRAVALRIPCAVLIRSPLEAITSMLAIDPRVSVDLAVRAYITFYRRIWDVRGSVVVCSFPEVVADASVVARRLNEHFGTHFDDRPVGEAERADVMQELDANRRANPEAWPLNPLPDRSPEMLARRSIIAARIRQTRLLPQAEEIYGRWIRLVPHTLAASNPATSS